MLNRIFGCALALCFIGGAHAETIAGWEVATKPDEKGICTITRNYADKDSTKNSVNILFGKGDDGAPIMVIAVGYGKWAWADGEKPKSDLLADNVVARQAVAWDSSGKVVLVSVFTAIDPLVQTISESKHLTLRFAGKKDMPKVFEVPNVGQAIGAIQLCRIQAK